ncbi:vanadium-dependent haloperoxidase [Tautonia rosea]|uniref:vanadium-dependent haloperoxidase n=1 Tax=Tautonia rosea TaxID=2728037 RepID=UPI001475749D|nr:vanadium-dependent haloperoxidase [Tautonia rosea]
MRLKLCWLTFTLIATPFALLRSASANFVTDWNVEVRNTIRATSTPPPRASRAMAMLHGAIYDATNAITRTHRPYRFRGVAPGASIEASAAQSARDVLVGLFPSRTAIYDAKLATQLSTIADGPAKAAGISLGSAVAAEMLSWRSNDGSDAPSSYTPTIAPGRWRPTEPGFAPALLPQWGAVTPFGITSVESFRPVAPPALDSVEYANAVNEVRLIGSATSSTRTADQTQIAQFWANGAGTETPPGHWNRIAIAASESRNLSIADNARMLAQLNIALADAAIVSWESKYLYDFWRPIDAIREGDTDGNPLTSDDDTWTPLLMTPPFPEYTSGHSTFSGAGAAALAGFFGTDAIAFTIGSDDIAGVERSYASFSAAASESGLSRIYGGIHFSFANVNGLSSGDAVGNSIAANYFQVIPEPSSLVLLGVGIAGLAVHAVHRRRRRR